MSFDTEGHVDLSPEGFQNQLGNAKALVEDALLTGTPRVFCKRAEYRSFIEQAADAMTIHPSCIVVRGSAHLGFSYAPRAAKVWRQFSPDSDIDLAFVDADRYGVLDSEIRAYERKLDTKKLGGADAKKLQKRANARRSYCYGFPDLPKIPFVQTYAAAMEKLSSIEIAGTRRSVNAFFYRDWWAIQQRAEDDLCELRNGLACEYLPAGTNAPRSLHAYEDEDLIKGLPNPDGVTELCLAEMENISAAGIEHIHLLTNLQSLWLDRLPVTPKALSSLSSLKSLRKLSLCKSNVAEDGLRSICGIKSLERLYLDDCRRISWQGIRQCRTIESLKLLSVCGCRLTRRAEIERAMPAVVIRWDRK